MSAPPVRCSWSLHVPASETTGDLVVMLHGCVQTIGELEAATRMNDAAAAHGWAVLWPEQTPAAHALRCWNWYLPEHQVRGGGEAGMLAELVAEVSRMHGFRRVFLCGMSAGAAMAAILAASYPELFAAAAFHSGAPFGALTNRPAGLALIRGCDADAVALGMLAHRAMGSRARVVPALVLHGADDPAVHPQNGTRLAQQFAVANRLAVGKSAMVPREIEMTHREEGRYETTIVRYESSSVEEWRIASLGHAWSGGSPEVPFSDPNGPDATAAVTGFFARCVSN